jgi:hypothetical protein
MLFWHVGASVAFVRYAFRDPMMDLRFLALGAILPDLVDLPIGIAMWDSFQNVRLGAHSMLFAAIILVAVLVATRRGVWRKRLILLAVGALLHLALDAMWQSPDTLWWPFLGSGLAPTEFASYGEYLANLLTNPVMWLGELAGASYLVFLFVRSGLGDGAARAGFLRTGVVSAPIDRT